MPARESPLQKGKLALISAKDCISSSSVSRGGEKIYKVWTATSLQKQDLTIPLSSNLLPLGKQLVYWNRSMLFSPKFLNTPRVDIFHLYYLLQRSMQEASQQEEVKKKNQEFLVLTKFIWAIQLHQWVKWKELYKG